MRNRKYLLTFNDAQVISHSNYRTLSVVIMSFRNYGRNYFRPVEEGGDRQIIANYGKAAVFESLVFLLSGLT